MTSETYWRQEGDDVVIVNPRSILRLNATSARAFLEFLDLTPPSEAPAAGAAEEAAALLRLLSVEGMLVRAGEGSPDPSRQRLAHIRATGNSD